MSLIVDGTTGVTFNDSSLQGAAASPYVLKNRIINGAMVIDQRNAGASITATNGFCLDRWTTRSSQSSKYTIQQNAGSVTLPAGFSNYLGCTSLSAYSVNSTDYFSIDQRIEGYNTADLNWGASNGKTITISFWVYSSLTGNFSGCVSDWNGSYSFPFLYSISSANTWTYITQTVTAPPTGTLWNTTNLGSIVLTFGLGLGSTTTAPSGSWIAGSFRGANSATSVVGTNGATFYITGVQLEIGTSATPFERRLYNQELANCQRYCLKYCGNTVFEDVNCNLIGFNTTTAYGTIFTVVPMRSSPSVTSGTLRLTDQTNVPTVTSVVASGSSYSGPYNINVGVNAASGVVQYRPYQLQANNSTSAYLILSAEL